MTKIPVLLFSGGIDSYVAYHWLQKPRTVYFDLGSRYSAREITVIQDLIPETIIDRSLSVGNREIGEKAYIPFRNLMLACLAEKYGQDIYIIGIEDDVVSDKNESIFSEFSNLLSKLEGKTVNVSSPFWAFSKVEIISWYLQQGLPKETLYETISCYSADEKSNYCGACPSCFRKWVAFVLSDLPLPFHNVPLAIEYYQAAKNRAYTEKRCKNIIQAVETFLLNGTSSFVVGEPT